MIQVFPSKSISWLSIQVLSFLIKLYNFFLEVMYHVKFILRYFIYLLLSSIRYFSVLILTGAYSIVNLFNRNVLNAYFLSRIVLDTINWTANNIDKFLVLETWSGYIEMMRGSTHTHTHTHTHTLIPI